MLKETMKLDVITFVKDGIVREYTTLNGDVKTSDSKRVFTLGELCETVKDNCSTYFVNTKGSPRSGKCFSTYKAARLHALELRSNDPTVYVYINCIIDQPFDPDLIDF